MSKDKRMLTEETPKNVGKNQERIIKEVTNLIKKSDEVNVKKIDKRIGKELEHYVKINTELPLYLQYHPEELENISFPLVRTELLRENYKYNDLSTLEEMLDVAGVDITEIGGTEEDLGLTWKEMPRFSLLKKNMEVVLSQLDDYDFKCGNDYEIIFDLNGDYYDIMEEETLTKVLDSKKFYKVPFYEPDIARKVGLTPFWYEGQFFIANSNLDGIRERLDAYVACCEGKIPEDSLYLKSRTRFQSRVGSEITHLVERNIIMIKPEYEVKIRSYQNEKERQNHS